MAHTQKLLLLILLRKINTCSQAVTYAEETIQPVKKSN